MPATRFSRRLIGPLGALAAMLIVLAPSASAGEVNTGYFGNVAIKGFDPVAYFTMGEAIEGSEDHAHSWLGAEWHFATAEHRDGCSAIQVCSEPVSRSKKCNSPATLIPTSVLSSLVSET